MNPVFTKTERQALSNLLWSTVATILGQACNLAVLLLLTRWLGAARYGALAFALTLQSYLTPLGSLMAGVIVVREGTRRPEALDIVGTAYLVATGTASLIVCLLVQIGTSLAPINQDERWLLMFFGLGVIPVANALTPLYIVHHRQGRAAMLSSLGEVFGLGAILLLHHVGRISLASVGAVYASKWALSTVSQGLDFHTRVRRLHWSFDGNELFVLLRSCWPILLANLVHLLPLSAGVFYVRGLCGPSEAGIYGLAYQGAGAYYTFAALGLQIAQPHIHSEYGLELSFLQKLLVFALVFLGGLGALSAFGGWLVTGWLLPSIYQAVTVPLNLLIFAAFLLLISSMADIYLVHFHEERVILMAHVGAAVVFAVLCPAFVWWRGTVGAALAAAVATGAAALVSLGRAAFHVMKSQATASKPLGV